MNPQRVASADAWAKDPKTVLEFFKDQLGRGCPVTAKSSLFCVSAKNCFVATSWDLELVIWNFDLRRDLLSAQGVSVPG